MTVGRRFGRRSDWWILCSILSLISTVMDWNWAPYFSASVFLVQVAGISHFKRVFIQNILGGRVCVVLRYFGRLLFFDTLTCKLASSLKLLNWHLIYFQLPNSKSVRVWHCDKLRPRPRRHGSKLSFSFALSIPLGSKRSTPSSVQLCPAWMKGSNKTDQGLKVGISNEHRKKQHRLGVAEWTQPKKQRRDWLDFFF